MVKRPYVLRNKVDGTYLIVNASNKAQALRTVAEMTFEAHAGTGAEVFEHMREGTKVVESSEAATQPELPGVED